MKKRPRTRGKSRTLRITPKGYAVLRAVARGTYKFALTGGPQPKKARC